MTLLQPPRVRPAPAEFRPEFIVPLRIVFAAAFLVSLFAVAFLTARGQIGEPDGLLTGMAVGTTVAAVLSWFGFLRVVWGRRSTSLCRLRLQDPVVAAGEPCRFTLDDPDGAFQGPGRPEAQLSYEEVQQRRTGRKRYREGPYVIDAPVTWDSGRSGATLEGSFTIPLGTIEAKPDADWMIWTIVILTIRSASGRRCRFALPWQG